MFEDFSWHSVVWVLAIIFFIVFTVWFLFDTAVDIFNRNYVEIYGWFGETAPLLDEGDTPFDIFIEDVFGR